MPVTHIWKVSSSNLGQGTDLPACSIVPHAYLLELLMVQAGLWTIQEFYLNEVVVIALKKKLPVPVAGIPISIKNHFINQKN
jgi:hypothetical protein